jgi:hypothetical protein
MFVTHLVDAADKTRYLAKAGGRNRWVCAKQAEPVAGGLKQSLSDIPLHLRPQSLAQIRACHAIGDVGAQEAGL